MILEITSDFETKAWLWLHKLKCTGCCGKCLTGSDKFLQYYRPVVVESGHSTSTTYIKDILKFHRN